jgi:hypothetical protein
MVGVGHRMVAMGDSLLWVDGHEFILLAPVDEFIHVQRD